MNAKNRLIEKLLKVAKKHKILTYPVLALVALISIFSYFFDWSTGAGRYGENRQDANGITG